ncbi:TAT-variant-translocated molybdopterin oxidoreductase [Haliangium ochraceum]|uniref:Molybdopterin oxidoreductase, iron-sulfur binding subunit n=1 Tax=Haliangium ochraceum (strain DSM 14365 / JCM 11303 / SMP-2) TaxID=502025 RepID=D0LJA3_HALO1|nr:TAT-variant-translocated molybdopterin oxidoreductase [Haliangium ochraceum]ACY14950.1 molybdopterin oxidoreductase, iron-sulfur binding subunit [Haliangium ochraceum DSM 14365]
MSSLDRDQTPTYWRSLEAFEARLDTDADLRARVESEFPEQAADLMDPLSRRRFMQLMGASMALAGVATSAGCQRWEREEIVPLSTRPEGYVPGEARYYATTLEIGGVGEGVLVQTYDGRPIKVEGNPMHPFGTGATTTFAQASVLSLYDPDRSMRVRNREGTGGWDEVSALITGQVAIGDGTGLRVLSEASSSPTLARLRQAFLTRYPNARWYEYEPVSFDNERLGLGMAQGGEAGNALRAIPLLARAKRILSLEADIFGLHPARLRLAADFARGRGQDGENGGEMSRLYAVESTFTTAGTSADHRLPLPASHIGAFINVLVAAFEFAGKQLSGGNAAETTTQVQNALTATRSGEAGDPQRAAMFETVRPALAVLPERSLAFIAALATDLAEHRGESVVVAGPGLSPELHANVAALNSMLGAQGQTVAYATMPGDRSSSHLQDIVALAGEMRAGAVQNLIVLGGNPAYTAPAELGFAELLGKVANSIHLGEYYDETAAACAWHVPQLHTMESWGDARSYDGTYSLVQPLIEPMWRDRQNRPGRTASEMVAMLLGRGEVNGQLLVRETFDANFGGGDKAWRLALHNGFVQNSAFPVEVARGITRVDTPEPAAIGAGAYEVVFRPSSHTYDGRFANNAWMQELPDFITKLTWDNAALINPNTAEQMGVKNGELIALTLGGQSVELPVYTLPGQARGSIAVALGHGRTHAGRVAGLASENIPSTGFNVYGLRSSAAAYVGTGVTVSGTGKSYPLASTQDHWNMDEIGREGIEERLPELIRESTSSEYRNKPGVIAEAEHEIVMPAFVPDQNGKSLFEEHGYADQRTGTLGDSDEEVSRYQHKWGMAIDLGKCTGCNACVVACQAENNIPVVGKQEVMNSREMHWIRIDRYFAGAELKDDPHIAHQPVACQQCEMAPCEQVCPVGATIHSSEGLNDMVYNRCVGTRYCLNNCPYRVRRFNFLDYQGRSEAPGGSMDDARNAVRKLLFNPEVTVRSRGVMEKCTFCVQRIQQVKIAAKNAGVEEVPDGAIRTACQQACPAGAIEFGDLNDENSRVSRAHSLPRSYALLTNFYTRPRNLFLARIRNPNPNFAG